MTRNWLRHAATPLLLLASSFMSSSQTHKSYILYVGNYGKGIQAYRYHAGSTKLEPLNIVGEVVNPSFLAVDPGFHYLYAASEVEGDNNGAIAAFSIDHGTGMLTA